MLYLDNPQEKSRVAYPQMGGGYTKKNEIISLKIETLKKICISPL